MASHKPQGMALSQLTACMPRVQTAPPLPLSPLPDFCVWLQDDSAILPQEAIEMVCELTDGQAVVSTGVGQHQMWTAQFYKFRRPRQWLTSGGAGGEGGMSALFELCLGSLHRGCTGTRTRTMLGGAKGGVWLRSGGAWDTSTCSS